MEKIKVYKISKRGARGHFISLPHVWVTDAALGAGDTIEVYREGERLILIGKKGEKNG